MTARIRVATIDDAEAIRDIYDPIVRDTAISFETKPPSVLTMQQRIRDNLERWPWLVCEQQDVVVGYVYGTRHRARTAYQWSVDVSVYIHAQARRSGIGRALYTSLFALLTLQGYYNCFAGITLPNAASVHLHKSLGFAPIGVHRSVGYKLGAWHDVAWWQLPLQSAQPTPHPPLAFRSLPQHSPGWETGRGSTIIVIA